MTRRTTALALSCVLFALAVTGPALERNAVGSDVAVESEHDPASCPPGHDHTICTQVQANPALGGTPARHEAHPAQSVIRAAGLSSAPLPSSLVGTHRSRAPPAA